GCPLRALRGPCRQHQDVRVPAPYVDSVQCGRNGYHSVTLPLEDGFEYSIRLEPVAVIQLCQDAGFTLREIRALLGRLEVGAEPTYADAQRLKRASSAM